MSLQPNQFGQVQLKMFMTPNEIRQSVTHANDVWGPDGAAPMDDHQLAHNSDWREKRRDNERPSGIGPSVRAEGVKEPVQLYFNTPARNKSIDKPANVPMLRNGHHRFIGQYDKDPNGYLPVKYDGDS